MIRLGLLTFFISVNVYSQAPMVGSFTAAPDEWLLSNGQRWHYHTEINHQAQALIYRSPNKNEVAVVEKAKAILDNSSAKAIALIDGDEIIWSGYKAPADSSSRFLSYSIGKTVTAMAIGKAICAGKLSLDDRAKKFVPELKDADLGKATVEQLLKMSSGTSPINRDTSIMSREQAEDMRAGKISLLDIVSTPRISDAYQGFLGEKRKPGEAFDYHSTDPLVLGFIINRATGMPYAKWVEKEVLIPAGIKSKAIIGQDHFGFGQSDGNVRMTLEDWSRFAIWVKKSESGVGCFENFVRQASMTQINNLIKREGKSFDGYGYLIWTENNRQRDSYWAVGYGGQRIAWNHNNKRILIAFSNVENYMDDLYWLYSDWSTLSN